MTLLVFKKLRVAVIAAAAVLAMLFSATTAAADNPPYHGCPSWAICLYEHQNGGGSKVIVTPDQWGRTAAFSVAKAHFLNGMGANDQVTSWLNNTTCQVNFYDLAPGPDGYTGYGGHLGAGDYAPAGQYGARYDFSGAWGNDRLSGLTYYCPN